MGVKRKFVLLLLRLAMGWLFFYAGITKVLNPGWTAKGYLLGAKTFPEFFQWFASSEVLAITDFLNQWGLTLIGLALIFGLFTRIASFLGLLLMLLYYFPILEFPKAGYGYLVDEHIVYALAFLVLIAFNAGRHWGIDNYRK